MRHAARAVRCAAVVWVLAGGVAFGYDGQGHHLVARSAVMALPDDVPGFFRQAGATIAAGSTDPDIFKLDGLPQLKSVEGPEHYFDLELLKGQAPPVLRYQMLDICAKEGIQPSKLGVLPYALAEWTQRLTVAFAEVRRWPDNPRLKGKCLAYAGILAHYGADTTMPLHTTVHYDGRLNETGKSPRSGIHDKVDALIHKLGVEPAEVAGKVRPEAFEQLWPAILAELDRSHALVDRTYELEAVLPGRYEALPEDPGLRRFARDRLEAAARFVASLYLTAWRDSAKLELPEWHVREREATETGRYGVRGPESRPAASQPARAAP